MPGFWSRSHLRLVGGAGVVGGLGWATLVVLTFVTGRGVSVLGYGSLDLFTPVSLALAAGGTAGYRSRTRDGWGHLTTAGFVGLFAGLLGAVAGSAVYVAFGFLEGWTLSVWSYFLALVGATVFGVGLLWSGTPPRLGSALLAGTLPVGLGASLALAFGGVVPDETVVPVGPGVLLGTGVATLGWWVWNAENEAD